METLGKKIYSQRKMKGLSQEQLADLIGVSRQAVSKWEADTAQPTFENLQILCVVLKLDISYFMNDWNRVKLLPAETAASAGKTAEAAEVAPAVAEETPVSEETSASEESALADREDIRKKWKRKKRVCGWLLVCIVCMSIFTILGATITVLVGLAVFSSNTGDHWLNSSSLIKTNFIYVFLITVLLLVLNIFLIRLFSRKKRQMQSLVDKM